mmetsp:Transcript_130268/g.405211  ORF Transcript_130268/g.405211 Transcript_130268/m.405211 type:complete len:259 (+) Transcript_130268:1042-1818(+)
MTPDVEEDRRRLLLHDGEELLELQAAVALRGAEDVAREALGVQAHGHVRLALDVALDSSHHLDGQCGVLDLEHLQPHALRKLPAPHGDGARGTRADLGAQVVQRARRGTDIARPGAWRRLRAGAAQEGHLVDVIDTHSRGPNWRGDLGRGLDRHRAVLAHPLTELLHRDEGDAVGLAEGQTLLQAHHLPILAHELADGGDRLLPRKAAKVVGRLGVASPLQHPAIPWAEGEHVARLGEVLGLALLSAEGSDRLAPVLC